MKKRKLHLERKNNLIESEKMCVGISILKIIRYLQLVKFKFRCLENTIEKL